MTKATPNFLQSRHTFDADGEVYPDKVNTAWLHEKVFGTKGGVRDFDKRLAEI